jgi:hypothetical protein
VLLARRAILQATGLTENQKQGLQQAVWRLELRLRVAAASQ